MITVPKQVEKQLGKDEFIEKNKSVISIPYKSISSINLKHERRGYLIILGILHSLAGALIFWTRGEGYSLLMIPAGLLIIYFGYSQVQHIELNISGRLKPLKIKGQIEKLDSLLDLIMRRREINDSKNKWQRL